MFLCKVEELNFSLRVYILRLHEYIINDSSMKLFVYQLTAFTYIIPLYSHIFILM